MRLKNMAVAGALALASMSAAPQAAFAQEGHSTQLSQCMRNGLIGAGVGALVGGLSSNHHRTQRAVIGAAVGGVGTWGVCRILTHREEQRVENAYQSSLERNRATSDSWSSDAGPRSVYVNRPQTAADAGPNCRTVRGTVSDPQNGRQQLPPETFCRNAAGQWIPV
jgi:surface antigen